MRKQNLLFSESYIMDNTTVAPLCRAQRRSRGGGGGEEKEKGGRPSIFDKEPLLWTGTAARLKHSLKWLSPPPPSFLSLCLSLPSAQCAGEWDRIANCVITAMVQAFVVFPSWTISSLQQGKIKLLAQLKRKLGFDQRELMLGEKCKSLYRRLMLWCFALTNRC